MCTRTRAADPLDIIERSPEPDRLHNRRCASLKAMWRMVIGDRRLRDLLDHLAATLIGRQPFEEFALPVEDADSCRAINLVPGKNIEVDVEVTHVDVEMHRPLRTVYEHGDPSLVRDSYYVLYRGRGPENVGHLRYRDDLRSIAQRALEHL